MIEITKNKQSLYFGASKHLWHHLHDHELTLDPSAVPGFPWNESLLDCGLLRNRKVLDKPDGRVHWTCGGTPLWLAFVWWDRSQDHRGASNSGFYVQGFSHLERHEAFVFACKQWPDVVRRQHHPLVL